MRSFKDYASYSVQAVHVTGGGQIGVGLWNTKHLLFVTMSVDPFNANDAEWLQGTQQQFSVKGIRK
jgi:hypothetical protein